MAALLHLLALFFSLLSSSSSLDPASVAEEAALLSVKASVSVDPEGLLSGWDPAVRHLCEWAGVSCDHASGRVTSLRLTGTSSSVLVGELSCSIGNLTELRVLSLRHNAFSGEIPAKAVGALRHLEVFDFHGNNFSGMLPVEIMPLPSLRVLDLSDNSLTGAIPADLFFSRLETVDLSFNQLSGKIGIGPSSSCRFLSHLKLLGNLLVDRIPPEIGKCVKIQILLLDRNILEGRIPAEIGELPELRILDVSRNSLTDRIPRELANCSMLSALVLTNVDSSSADGLTWGSNVDEFNAFVGFIPPEIFSIPGLEILWAPRANLGGRLPSNHNGSCSLRILNLGQNYVSGAIPGWLGMCRNLSFLDLSSNYLQGDLPASLGISCMAYFNVSHNLLSGPLFNFSQIGCSHRLVADGWNGVFLDEQTLLLEYSMNLRYAARKSNMPGSIFGNDSFVILHDFSWNYFTGSLPSFIFPVGIISPYGLI